MTTSAVPAGIVPPSHILEPDGTEYSPIILLETRLVSFALSLSFLASLIRCSQRPPFLRTSLVLRSMIGTWRVWSSARHYRFVRLLAATHLSPLTSVRGTLK